MKIPKFIRFPHFRGPRTIASRLTWRVVITLLIIYLILSVLFFLILFFVGFVTLSALFYTRMSVTEEKVNNIFTAVEIAKARDEEGHAMVPEVGIFFGGHLLRGNRTTKQSAEEFNAFESYNYPHLVNAGVNITYHRERMLAPDWQKPMKPHFRLDNNVIIFSLFPGIREDLIRHIIHTPNLKAIVMRTFGSGNAPQSPWLLKALREGTRNGKVIVNISQCMQGAVEMSRYDCGFHLQEAGVVSGYDQTVESAVTKLMFLQSHYPDDPDTVRRLMGQSLRGEITV